MKLTSLAVLSLLAALACPIFATDFIVDRVNKENAAASEFFFDSGKGLFWQPGAGGTMGSSAAVDAFIEAWKKNSAAHNNDVSNMEFLGEWGKVGTTKGTVNQAGIVEATEHGISEYAVQLLVGSTSGAGKGQLTADGADCWAHASSNVLQYWQSYYGVFSSNKNNLQLGYAVKDKQTAVDLLGTQSLKLTKWFYIPSSNKGGQSQAAMISYLTDKAYSSSANTFGDYFANAYASVGLTSVSSSNLTDAVFKHMDCSLVGGQVVQNSYGKLAEFTIGYADGSGVPHALTLYGFGVDDAGKVNRLYYADSDDQAYGIKTYYLKAGENGDSRVYLYSNADYTLSSTEKLKYVYELVSIQTPDNLKEMGKQYWEGDLEWSGKNADGTVKNTWTAGEGLGSTAEKLPTGDTGWRVAVNNKYYDSFFYETRDVRFNDAGNPGREIKISGTAKAHNMTIDAVSKDYTFNANESGAADSIVLAGDLIKSGAAKASFGLKISAAGLSVKSGTLAVGSGCTLTISGTSKIERGATLSVGGGGGTASLGNATFAAGSVLSVSGTQNTLNASSLTFADGARLSFDLSNPDTRSNTMLTINTTPDFKGKVYFDFVGGNVDEEYKLIYFGGSAYGDWLNNFVSYNGTFSLSGNTLVLKYADEKKATWSCNGGAGTWSSSSIDDQWSSTPEGASVTFDADHAGTVTVSGTVNPSAINVTGGTYVFESDANKPGSIFGSRDLTISGTGTSLTAKLDLGARAVKVQDAASFVYDVADSVQLAGLEVAFGASATFQGSGTYDVYNPSVDGFLTVDGTATLALHSDVSVSKAINLTMTEKASVQFRNTSNSGMVSYSLATDPSAGTINVGSADDTFGTRLNVSSAATTYTVAKDSILSIGKATAAFTASGEGTVLVDSDKPSAYLSVTSGGALKDVNLHIAGTATMSCYETGLQLVSASGKDWTVSGTLNLELTSYDHTENSAPVMSLSRLHLDGGTLSGKMGVDALVACKVDELNVTQKGGSITWAPSSTLSGGAYTPTTVMEIDSLRVEGTLQMTMTGSNRSGMFLINETDCLSGIELRAGDSASTSACHQLLQLNGGEIKGGVKLTLLNGSRKGSDSSVTTWNNYGHVVVGNSLKVGGLDSELVVNITKFNGYDCVRLQGGTYDMGRNILDQTGGPVKLIIETHDDVHTFTGHIENNIDIAKQGAGTQKLIGDLSAFNGSISVEGGALVMSRDSERTSGTNTLPLITLDNASNPTTLNATSLSISGGATLESNLTVKVSGAFEARAYVSDLVGAAEAATLALDDAVGTNATENPVATINAALDLSNATSLTFETGVDLGGQALILWSDGTKKALTLSQSMGVSQNSNGTYDVTLFKNVGGVSDLSSYSVDAATLFTSDNLTENSTLVYNSTEKTIVLTSVTFDAPEPTTATLALLGLMGLCARRRRQKSASSN